jgi:hypothetical protein
MYTKTTMIVGVLIAFFVGALIGGLYSSAKKSSDTSWGRAYTGNEIVGLEIKSPAGDSFGTVADYVIDTNGRVPFVVVSYQKKAVAVPFESLNYDTEGRQLVLNLDKEKLDSAPAFDKTALKDRTWAEETYRHFGQAPYWGEIKEQAREVKEKAKGFEGEVKDRLDPGASVTE